MAHRDYSIDNFITVRVEPNEFIEIKNPGSFKEKITPEVYRRMHGNVVVAKTYESLGRKIRGLCNQFVSSGILTKSEKSAYLFNFDFKKRDKLL